MTATAISAATLPHETEPTPMLQFGFYAFCIFNLAVYSRIFEWKFTYLHVPLITSSIALLGAGMDGRLLATFRSRIGICMAALTLLYAANVPLSTWRSESFTIFTGEWLKSLMTFMIAGALVVTFKQCRTALNSIGWGSAIAAVLTLVLGKASIDGRLQVGRGTLGNPNEIAFILLLGLPFLCVIAADSAAAKPKRLLALCLAFCCTFALIRTGSRTGLIGLFILSLLIFFRASFFGKILMAIAVASLGALAITAFPAVVERYGTMFLGTDAISQARTAQEAMNISSAVDSSHERRTLLIESLQATAEHPLMGVGLGAFGAYMAGKAIAAGHTAHFQGTHNSYTQISSEAGVPALILFLCIMIFIFDGLRKIFKRARQSPTSVGRQVANVAFALMSSLIAYSIYIFFDFVAYDITLPVLAGFAIALSDTAGKALDVAEANANLGEHPAAVQTILLPLRRRYPVQPAV